MLGTLREFQRRSALAARKLPTCFSWFQGGEGSPEPGTTPRWEGEGLQGYLSSGGELFAAVQPGRTPFVGGAAGTVPSSSVQADQAHLAAVGYFLSALQRAHICIPLTLRPVEVAAMMEGAEAQTSV